MKSNYREIWPTPIGEYWLEDINIHNELIQLIDKKYQTWKGDDSMNLFDIDCNFSLWVKECVKDYTSKFGFPTEKVEFQRAWCTTQPKYHDNYIHVHNLVDLACVYYVDVLPNHPPLEILDPREPHKFNRVRRKMADGHIASGFISIQIPPEKYKLVIHPGYLKHGVGVNMQDYPRTSVAMNTKVFASADYKPPISTSY